ncbi:MAG: class I SAM-dependent methyltransferase [Oscillospiraceae bacterium]|jgi:SAM-dependent methyltransferase|nr:class I SAM-dependent methyltransferase [Oscillospiraceae bacterium]
MNKRELTSLVSTIQQAIDFVTKTDDKTIAVDIISDIEEAVAAIVNSTQNVVPALLIENITIEDFPTISQWLDTVSNFLTSYTPYDEGFYEDQEHVITSAEVIIPLVLQSTGKINSVLDVGCGMGAWLSVFNKLGVSDIAGIDGDYVNRENLLIPSECFTSHNLDTPFDLNRKFDLVSTLEVAEHIPKKHADTFVESLCKHSNQILFSAAFPGQMGTDHINEAFPSYWAGVFKQFGFYPIDCLRYRIWDDTRISWWYRNNCLFFANESSNVYQKNQNHVFGPLDIVHPIVLSYYVNMIFKN